jgi:mRNA interferase RelE/StbE
MTRYTVLVSPAAEKELAAVRDRLLSMRLKRAIAALGDDPRPPGCIKLRGAADDWRVRVGDWRIVYRIEDDRLVVLVVTVAPRGGVYG